MPSRLRKKLKLEGSEVVHRTEDVLVLLLKTYEAACLYGKGTKWCINGSADVNFQHWEDRVKTLSRLFFVRDFTRQSHDPLYKVCIQVSPFSQNKAFDSKDKALDFEEVCSTLSLSPDTFSYVPYSQDEFLDAVVYGSWSRNSDGTIDVDGNVEAGGLGLTSLPCVFRRVSGVFDVRDNELASRAGFPSCSSSVVWHDEEDVFSL
jgi:hypothetical protein